MADVTWNGAVWSCDAESPMLTPHATRALIHGDCRLVLDTLPEIDVVLTDPPYVWSPLLCGLEDQGVNINGPEGLTWPVLVWMQQWYPLVCMRSKVGVWLTTDRLYLPYYALGGWPVQRWALEPACDRVPWLCWIGKRPLLAEPTPETLALYRYGSDSPTAFWSALLALTPGDRGILLDPFCGTGSTLVAGRQAGYRTIGIEQDAAIYARCHMRTMHANEVTV